MNENKKQLEERRDEKTQWEEQLQQSYVNLGQLLDEKTDVDPSFQNPIKEKQQQIDLSIKKKKQLENLEKKLQKLDEKEKEELLQKKEIKSAIEDHYGDIGIESYRIYKQGRWEEPGYQAVFEKLNRLEDKIQDADNDLFRLRTSVSSKGIWNRINRKVREKTNQTIKKSAGGNLQKQYAKAGELLLDFNSFKTHFQEDMPELYKKYILDAEKLESLEQSIEKDRKEKIRLLEEQEIDQKSIEKTISRLEQEQDQLEQDLEQLYLVLGKDYWINKKVPEEMEAFREQILMLQEKDRIAGLSIEEIQLKISMEAIESDKQNLVKKRSRKKEQLEEMEKDIATLDQSIGELDNELSDVEKKRKKLEKEIAKGEKTE